ncbi:hypothetical protein L195_g063001, partial [Trifolium pratense]
RVIDTPVAPLSFTYTTPRVTAPRPQRSLLQQCSVSALFAAESCVPTYILQEKTN